MDRGVSDVLGYILIFALISSSVALVTVSASTSLENVRDAERFENAQRVFDILDENIDDHLETGVESRGTEIRLADAGLTFADPVLLNVSVAGVGYNLTTSEPLVYKQSADRQIRFVAGATIRDDRGYARVTRGPPFRFGEETILTLVRTRGRDGGISGSGRVLVRTERATQSFHAYEGNGPYSVTINVTTDHPDAWARWLQEETGRSFTVEGDLVSNQGDPIQTETLYVRAVTIDVFLT